jgi:hypothetical protein
MDHRRRICCSFFALVLLAVEALARSKSAHMNVAGIVLMWFSSALFIVWTVLLTSCVFFGWPISAEALPLWPKQHSLKQHPPEPISPPHLELEQSRLLKNSTTETNSLLLTSWKNVGASAVLQPEFRTIIEAESQGIPLYVASGQFADIFPTATRLITDRLPRSIQYPWTNLLIYSEIIFKDSSDQMFTQQLVTRPLIQRGHTFLSDVRTGEKERLESHFRAAAQKLDKNTAKTKTGSD